MKKILFFLAAVLLVCSVLQADIMAPGVIKPTREIQQAGRAIWNFTPQKIIVPPDIIVEYVDMFASLAVLSRRLAERD